MVSSFTSKLALAPLILGAVFSIHDDNQEVEGTLIDFKEAERLLRGEVVCGGVKLTGKPKSRGKGGQFGIIVGMHHDDDDLTLPPTVAVKIMNTAGLSDAAKKTKVTEAQFECDVMQDMEKKRVPNALRCLALCEVGGAPVLVTSPFVPMSRNVQQSQDGKPIGIGPRFFQTDAAGQTDAAEMLAVKNTVETALAFVRNRVANTDQGHNVFYFNDGNVLFFDFGMAQNLTVKYLSEHNFLNFHVVRFLLKVFANIPFKYRGDSDSKGGCLLLQYLQDSPVPPGAATAFELTSVDAGQAATATSFKKQLCIAFSQLGSNCYKEAEEQEFCHRRQLDA